ncbi:MAG TPA: GNAT family N-acetyltransferase [Actinomycetota bacterium]|nr:GNAT family N-acetyltransferase [Actinomycetota bacterium]
MIEDLDDTCVELEALSPELVGSLLELMELAYGLRFSPHDWDNASGGRHFIVFRGGAPVAHASVVPRPLSTPELELATGFVEAVATRPDLQGRGLGTEVMHAAQRHIHSTYELGGLSTGSGPFYERLGWEQWQGPTYARTPQGWLRTEEDDYGLYILRTPSTPDLDLTRPISCDWRVGDVW